MFNIYDEGYSMADDFLKINCICILSRGLSGWLITILKGDLKNQKEASNMTQIKNIWLIIVINW